MRNQRITMLLAGIGAALAVLAGCGAPADPATGPTSAEQSQCAPNDADVRFVQGMLPHHRQAVEMAELAAGRTENPEVVDLAARIGAAQAPEIETMTGWLREWGEEVPADGGMAGMEGMDHGGGMAGMMSPDQMSRLEGSTGPAFDRLFLEQMTEHHDGAVAMARTELDEGVDPDALALAQAIVDSQQAEIDEMAALLAQL